MWDRELAGEAAIGHKILILPGAGRLMPSAKDGTGFEVNPATLIYPSDIFPAARPQPDQLGMLLTSADRFGMQVFVGSLQTYGDWSSGEEFHALHKYDPIVAKEILARYGSHPSLNSGQGNWYFSHEIWLNWVKFYGPGYYAIGELGTYVSAMKALGAEARVIEAPVFKQAAVGPMPGLSAAESGVYVATLVNGSGVDIVAPQDGAGVQAGAPPVSDLPDYYSEMRRALDGSIAAGTVELWATTETFQAANAGSESANGWQPAPISRIRRQMAAEAPCVAHMIEFMYGWDMSPEAAYTPVEADTLLAQYTGSASGAASLPNSSVTYNLSPSASYRDTFPSKITNGTGGGFRASLPKDWVGFAGDPSGLITVTLDLNGVRTISGLHTLFAGSASNGVYFPRNVLSEYSADGGLSWAPLGNPSGQTVELDTPLLYSVGWTRAVNPAAVVATHVRVTVSFWEWLFLGEMKVMLP